MRGVTGKSTAVSANCESDNVKNLKDTFKKYLFVLIYNICGFV
jgi:hypothetical protein